MKRLALLLLIACGAPEDAGDVDAGPDLVPAVAAGGQVKPYLSVNGDTSPAAGGDWYPTGVAFDARGAGWRLSCLNGRQPYLAAAGDGFLSLRCPADVRE